MGNRLELRKGHLADTIDEGCVSYYDAEVSATENSANNAWNVNLSDGNTNNNNKYNNNYVRAVAALGNINVSFVKGFLYAYEDCLKGKRTSTQAIEYMSVVHKDLPELIVEVWTYHYKPSTSTCFMVTFPKLREVFAAHFRDRIIHHWICIRLLPLFERRSTSLGNVSHACRKGFGTRTAVLQVYDRIKSISVGYTKPAWIYRGDIVGFFMHINKKLLWKKLEALIMEQYFGEDKKILLSLVEITVFHNPEKDCVINSDPKLWEEIQSDKSLFYIDDELGMPIGNLTTQLFAGYFLSFLDEFVIKRFYQYFGEEWYLHTSYTRSVDDFCVVTDDRLFAKWMIEDIDIFCKSELELSTHLDKVYFQPVSHGVKFLGHWIMNGRIYTHNRTVGRFIEKVKKLLVECQTLNLTALDCWYWQMCINSYFGFLVNTRSYKIREKIVGMLTPDFYRYFYVVDNRKIEIKNEYKFIGDFYTASNDDSYIRKKPA